jgi:ASC-1-like (ASCH) protein
MATYVLRIRHEDRRFFDALQDGTKAIETRAASPQYIHVKRGDTLMFVCNGERLLKTVARKQKFSNLPALVHAYDFRLINPFVHSKREFFDMYNDFPMYKQKIKKFGVIAFEFEK